MSNALSPPICMLMEPVFKISLVVIHMKLVIFVLPVMMDGLLLMEFASLMIIETIYVLDGMTMSVFHVPIELISETTEDVTKLTLSVPNLTSTTKYVLNVMRDIAFMKENVF